MSEQEPFGLGCLGTGRFAASHGKTITNTPQAQLVACWDPNPDAANRFAEQFGCEVASSREALLSDPRVEAVVAPVPNQVHEEAVLACAAAGKPVLVEKPLANSVAEGLRMIDACRKADVVLAVGHNTRHDPVVRWLKDDLEQGKLGTVGHFDTQFNGSKAHNLDTSQWRFHQQQCPNLPLNMLGSHMIDTIVYLLGPVREVSAIMDCDRSGSGNDDNCSLVMRLESGVVGTLTATYVTHATKYVRVHGTEAVATANFHPAEYVVERGGGENRHVDRRPRTIDNGHQEQLLNYIAAVRGDVYEAHGEVALQTVAVMEAARISAAERRVVTLDEVLNR
jgi:predicted dehydrogenase